MENNRRSFFKGLAAFASGVVAAKVTSYIPKKEEPKEELMVSNTITFNHNGVDYHPIAVKKTDMDVAEYQQPKYPFNITNIQPKIRKANI
jgi:hypothetical protein